jgi:pantoate--beta-alanine ligase
VAELLVLTETKTMRAWSQEQHRASQRIALVPTMGYLHAGHLSLVKAAQERADKVVVSIFVNPLQFGPREDLSRYPRDLQGDLHKLAELGVDAVFAPDSMYSANFDTSIAPDKLGAYLCGASRPGHFRGVCTVVAILFGITQCNTAVFGEKDFQQLQIIRRMNEDLWLGVEIVGMPILREADGLAMSSRNAYLSSDEREQALVLNRALRLAEEVFAKGERQSEVILQHVHAIIQEAPLVHLDYAEIVDLEMLQPLAELNVPALCALAVYVGKTRLIDNVKLI